jgi:hypothetical protein
LIIAFLTYTEYGTNTFLHNLGKDPRYYTTSHPEEDNSHIIPHFPHRKGRLATTVPTAIGKPLSGAPIVVPANLLQLTLTGRYITFFEAEGKA